MKDNASKIKWNKPELTILIHSNPEEKVLTACKGTDIDGASNIFDNCIGDPSCSECSSIGAS